MSNNNIKKTVNDLNEKIDILNYIITKFESKIIRIQNEEIRKLCINFKNHYNKLIKLKRFCIPVFGKISSGKSTLLNYIMHLHGVFETDYNISTKFVCIIRHNSNLNKAPKIFNVLVNERGEYIKQKKILKLWNFEKGEEIIGNPKEIIEKRNHELNQLDYRDSHWEKYFMILETNIPLFRGENSIYSDLFEFMDIPGLNEFNGAKKETDHFYYKELLPFFIYNIGFSLYVFDAEKKQSVGAISIINNIMKEYYNNDEDNQKNSIFILNKIDRVNDEKNEINNLKKILEKNLKCHIEKYGHFIGLSGLTLYLKSFKYESFFDYLFCIIEEENNESQSIEEFIIDRMSKDFQTNIEENFENENDEELPPDEERILKHFNDKIINKGFIDQFSESNYLYYKKLFEGFKINNKKEDLGMQHKNFEETISKCFMNIINDYINNFKYENLTQELLKELGLDEENLKIIMIRDKSTKTTKLDDPISFIKSFKNILDSLKQFEPNNEFINQLVKEYETTLLYMDEEKKIRIPLLGEYSSGKSSLLNTLIGKDLNIIPVDSNVCTNIALVIRYTESYSDIALYHTMLEPTNEDYYCFKENNNPIGKGYKVVHEILKLLNVIFSSFEIKGNYQMKVINYIEKQKDLEETEAIKLISNLTKALNGDIPFESIQNIQLQLLLKEIAKEKENIGKNNDQDFYQRAFFLLTVPIEAYDLILSKDIKDIKKKIELIDFPGLDSTNNIFNSNVLSPLLKFSDGFIFVNKGNSIKESEKGDILKDIIIKIQKRKFEFSFKSCLFLICRCDETDVNIEECKDQFESIFEINKREQIWNDIISKSEILKNADNINVTKFSNKLFHEFKIFKNRVDNFESFIKFYEEKIDTKVYQGKKYLMKLQKQIKSYVSSISNVKYNCYIVSENIDKYKQYFQEYMTENGNIPIIEDIIKMYLFIKDSIYYSKIYIKSNAQDFFYKIKNQFILSKFFYEESLKTLAIKYLLNLYSSFEFMKIKILQEEIDIKFTNEEFIKTKENLENVYKIEKEKIKEYIDSTIIEMKNEYDKLINDIKKGTTTMYEESLKNTSKKIEKHKFNLESKINDEIPKFRTRLLKQLNLITEKLKRISVNKGNLSSYDLFKSINDAEMKTFEWMGKGSLGLLVLDLGFLGFSAATTVAVEGAAVAITSFGHAFFSLATLASLGVGAAIGLAIPYTIHGGFTLYKKFVEKKKYIELISNAKKELEKSLSNYEENINIILKKITDDIELAVKRFFLIQNVKLDGIKKHMGEWLLFREQIINNLQK